MIKKTLAQLRAEKHMSQRELAQRIGVSSAAIGMYETGKRSPSLNRAIAIAKIFGIPIESISLATGTSITERNSSSAMKGETGWEKKKVQS